MKKVNIKHISTLVFMVPVLWLLLSCSAERKNVISKAFHNTTAHYNAYFYAKQKINEIETSIWEQNDDDYHDILNIYPPVDTTLANSYVDNVDECVKMASLAIQRHKNSKWLDDSYILIGRARFLSLDYVNSVETFKFVNTKSEDLDAKHEALARLMRTFTDNGEYNNAIAVSDYLKKEKLNRDNQKILYLNRAHLHQVRGNHEGMVENLRLAVPLLKRREKKARINFILGQLYQSLDMEKEAHSSYKKCVSSNPDYELSFYAKLNMTQVSELSDNGDVKTARRLFRKLLKDKKNQDFKDKIYYEMAEFEAKQGNIEKAVDFYKASIGASTANNRQKGQSYLKLGIVYYDSLAEYELAKAYYDSAVTTLPPNYKGYEEIKSRQAILADFVEQMNIIEEQDSLLTLAGMDSTKQMAIIHQVLEEQKALAKAAEERAKKESRRAGNRSAFDNNRSSGGSSNWYFENPAAVSRGMSEFKRKWGDRVLEDNWRRSDKVILVDSDSDLGDGNDSINGGGKTAANGEIKSEEELAKEEALALYNKIPKTEADKKAALDKVEDAHYHLGKIYHFNLDEDDNSVKTFKALLQRFPSTGYEPEVLYLLYLISKDFQDGTEQQYKEAIIAKHPYTTYAKLLSNPNYTQESTAANEQLKKIYKEAYQYYENEDFEASIKEISTGLNLHPEATFAPRLKLLKILVVGKTEDPSKYQYELENFIEQNPDSDITPYASTLLKTAREFKTNQSKVSGARYVPYFEQVHYFVLIYEAGSEVTDQLTQALDGFNKSNFGDSKLNTGNLSLDDDSSIILVSELKGITSAIDYFQKLEELSLLEYDFSNLKMHKFVITKDNFGIFYETGDLDGYLKFFEKHYQNGN